MESLARDMQRIKDEIVSLRGARNAFMGELKGSVDETRRRAATMIYDFGRERAENAKSRKADLVSFATELRTQVNGIIDENRNERFRMAAGTRAERLECVTEIKHSIHELKNAVHELLAGFEQDRTDKSKATRADLNAFISDLLARTREMLSQFDADHGRASKETQSMLADCLADTRRFVADKKQEIQGMQKDFTATRLEKARADSHGREDFIDELTRNVAGLRQESNALLLRMSENFRWSGQIWRGHAPAQTEPGPSEVRPEKKAKPKVEEEAEKPEARPEEKPLQAESIIEQEKAIVPETEQETTALEETEKVESITAEKNTIVPETEQERAALGETEQLAEPVLKKEETFSDDLTLIPEIGSSRARQLNEAGIYTFEQLSLSSRESLQNVIKEKGRQPDFEKWIQAAKDLASQEG